MRIAAYCRVSTDKDDQLNSLEAQKRFFTEFADKNGHTLVRLYADEGISGTKIKNRLEFQKLMQDARRGLFEMVVVKDISRFARNTVDLLQSVRTLKALGIETVFLTANMSVLGQSEFVLTIFGALAQEESANTSKRIKFGKKINAEKGRVPNLVFGYDKTNGDYFNLSINEDEASVVRQIYDWYINEGLGTLKIANRLNEMNIRTKRGCEWSQNAVCRILSNEIYTGVITNGKEEIADFLTGKRISKDEGDWIRTLRPELRIISPEQFKKAQELLKARSLSFNLKNERQSNTHLFSTLIKCKDCGRSFRRLVRKYRNTYVRWVCSTHNGIGASSCPNDLAIDEDELISALQNYFIETLASKGGFTQQAANEILRLCKLRNNDKRSEKELRRKLARLEKTRQKYMDMYADDLITREELIAKIGGMKEQIAQIENDLRLIKRASNLDKQLESLIRRMFTKPEDIVDLRQLTNSQLKRIVEKIEVGSDGNIEIYLRHIEARQSSDAVPVCYGCT